MFTMQDTLFFAHSNPLTVLIGLIGLIPLYIVGTAIYNIYLHPLASYLGPKLWCCSQIPWAYYNITGTLYLETAELHRIYGPVVRIAPDKLSYISAEAWTDIHTLGSTKQELRKHPLLNKGRVGIFQAESRDDHQRIRNSLKNAFSVQAMRDQEPQIQSLADLMIQRLHEISEKGPVDIASWYSFAAFDIMGALTFGEDFDCLKESRYHPWIGISNDTVKAAVVVAMTRLFPPLDNIIYYLVPKSIRVMRAWHGQRTADMLAKRMSQKDPKPDFLTHALMTFNTEKGPNLIELQQTCETLVVAGSDTSASLLAGVTYHLLKNPSTMAKLTSEIRSNFADESEINMTSVNSLKYQLAVLDEAMRIFPPVAGTFSRITSSTGNTIAGRYVPPNIGVGMAHWAAYHSPENFKDPEAFVPERWLGDPEYAGDKKNVFQPFSVGPRNCIGRNLGYAEMRLLLARTLWNFDMQLCEEHEDWVSGQIAYILWKKTPLKVKLIPRSH